MECKLGYVVSSNNRSIGREYPHRVIKYLDTGSITSGKIDGIQINMWGLYRERKFSGRKK